MSHVQVLGSLDSKVKWRSITGRTSPQVALSHGLRIIAIVGLIEWRSNFGCLE